MLGIYTSFRQAGCGEYARCCSSALEVKYYAFPGGGICGGLKCLVPESLRLVRKPGSEMGSGKKEFVT